MHRQTNKPIGSQTNKYTHKNKYTNKQANTSLEDTSLSNAITIKQTNKRQKDRQTHCKAVKGFKIKCIEKNNQ